MVGAAIVLGCRFGCYRWTWLLLAQVACVVGQALNTMCGAPYALYGSNFWEQVTIGTALLADGIINEGPGSWIAAQRSEHANAADGHQGKLVESLLPAKGTGEDVSFTS